MNRKYAGLLVVILCTLLVGFLFGVAFDARYRPDLMTLYLESNTKLSVQPRPGNIVRWVAPGGESPSINFILGKSPCHNSNPADACWYDPSGGYPLIALYDCKLDKNPGACSDPGVGPKSGTGPIESTQPPFFQSFWVILWIDLERFDGNWPELTPKVLNALAGSPNRAEESEKPERTTLGKLNQVVAAAVACNNGTPAVYDSQGQPFDPIPAHPGDTVSWYPYADFSISGLSICKVAPGSGGTENCNIDPGTKPGAVPYTLTVQGCGNPSTFHIQVQ